MNACLEEPPIAESDDRFTDTETNDDTPPSSNVTETCLDKFRDHYRRWQLSEGTGK